MIRFIAVSLIDQHRYPSVLFRANQPAYGLHHTIDTWMAVCKVKSIIPIRIKMLAASISFQTHLRKSYSDHNDTNQCLSSQVYPFAKYSPHYG